jgi:hypothetical protein
MSASTATGQHSRPDMLVVTLIHQSLYWLTLRYYRRFGRALARAAGRPGVAQDLPVSTRRSQVSSRWSWRRRHG